MVESEEVFYILSVIFVPETCTWKMRRKMFVMLFEMYTWYKLALNKYAKLSYISN